MPLVVSQRTGNLFLILGVIATVEYDLVEQGRVEGVATEALPSQLTFVSFFGAVTNILYAYGGHWLFFEMISTLKDSSSFPRVFLINVPVQVLLNLMVALTGYYFLGAEADGYLLVTRHSTRYTCTASAHRELQNRRF